MKRLKVSQERILELFRYKNGVLLNRGSIQAKNLYNNMKNKYFKDFVNHG